MATTFRFDLVTAQVSTLDLPAARFVVSSRPYPVECVESVACSAIISGGALATGLYSMQPEPMTSAAALTAGSLRPGLLTLSIDDDKLAPSAGLSSGELRQLVKSLATWEPEGAYSSAALSSGQLKVALLSYTNWPAENLTFSAALNSGTLS